MAIDMRVSNTNWDEINDELLTEFGFPDDIRTHGVAWLYAAVYRTRDEHTRKLIEFGNSDGRIFGQRSWSIIILGRTGLQGDEKLDIKQSGQSTTCRLAKSRLGDVIIVEWEIYHPGHEDPEIYVEKLISRLRHITEQNSE